MSDPTDLTSPTIPSRAIQRAQAVSKALSDAARRARFSVRARRAYRGGSFELRRGAKLMRIMRIVLFVAMVAIPDLLAITYFGLVASDQYVSEAQFTVSSGAIPKMDGIGSITGVPPIMIVQDTLVVKDYIESRALVEQLERTVGLREAYSANSIDWFSRFRKDKPIEKFTDYWDKMSDVSIAMPSGIVKLTVRAYTPEDAKRIADSVVKSSEDLINGLNERMRADTVLSTERDMQDAAQQLARARMQMEFERNAEGLIDINQTGGVIANLISQLKTDLLGAQQEYQTQLRYVSEDAPQMAVLKNRIAAMQSQLNDLNSKLTAQSEQSVSAVADKALSGKMTKFAELDLEERIAEKRYSLSAAAVEAARMLGERRMLYLHEIVPPAMPEEAKYPKRWLSIGMTVLASFLAWAATVGAISFVRNHMA